MNNLDINLNPNLSLNDLVDRQAEGFSVMRSAHVGNQRAYNLAIADAGIPMLLVDHTVTGVDKNYVPEAIIKGGELQTLTTPGQLVLRTTVNCPETQTTQYLDELHKTSLRTAFPETTVMTNTEYLRANEPIASEVINVCGKTMPSLFTRLVRLDGTVSRGGALSDRASAANTLQLQDDPRTEQGILLPNEVDIVCNFIIEALNTDQATQFHISGPDMVNYIKGILPTLNTLYSAVQCQASFGPKLPSQLRVELVPGTALRFATTMNRQDDLTALLDVTTETTAAAKTINSTKGKFFGSTGAKDTATRTAFLAEIAEQKAMLTDNFRQQLVGCDDLFVDPRQAPFMSQYDVIQESGLYIPKELKDLTMAELSNLFATIKACMKGNP